jgi:hypothetical protein
MDTNMNLLENGKESSEVFDGNIDFNMAASGAPITIKEKWRLKCKGHDPFLVLLDPRPLLHGTSAYGDMRKPGMRTSDTTVSSRSNFTDHCQHLCRSCGANVRNSNIGLTFAE